jgi:hypothetical protein
MNSLGHLTSLSARASWGWRSHSHLRTTAGNGRGHPSEKVRDLHPGMAGRRGEGDRLGHVPGESAPLAENLDPDRVGAVDHDVECASQSPQRLGVVADHIEQGMTLAPGRQMAIPL